MNTHSIDSPIFVEHDNAIAVITLNRPGARNCLNQEMIGALDKALDDLQAIDTLRAVVLTGRSGHFCSGADLSMVADLLATPYRLYQMHDRIVRIASRIHEFKIPVIAAINGHAFGGGAELALACDIRIMEQSTKLCLPEARLGIMPGAGGTARLARIVGVERALYYELTGEAISADEAVKLGLILRMVPDSQGLADALNLANKINKSAPAAVEFIKRALRTSLDMPLYAAMEHCQYAALLLGHTQDAQNGINAFFTKETPNWRGE